MKDKAFVEFSFWGLGDNIWQRPYIIALTKLYKQVYFYTPWPQIYNDVENVVLLNPYQDKENNYFHEWTCFKDNIDKFNWPEEVDLSEADIYRWRNDNFGFTVDYVDYICPSIEPPWEYDLSFNIKDEWKQRAKEWLDEYIPKKPRVLFHPPANTPGVVLSRDADYKYFRLVFEKFKDRVSFYDSAVIIPGIIEHAEKFDELVIHDSKFTDIEMFFGMVANADIIVCGDNHMFPLAVSTQKSTLFFGPVWPPCRAMTSPRLQLDNVRVICPKTCYDCFNKVEHVCDKTLDEDLILQYFEGLLADYEQRQR